MKTDLIKKELLNQCQNYVEQRLHRIQHTILDIQESLSSETKSTAGDKHETGRAMLQLEREKAGRQLSEVQKLQVILSKIDISNPSKNIHLGTLVYTSNVNYFISISAGSFSVADVVFYAIAPDTPIGKLLLGKTSGDYFTFNGVDITIEQIY